MGYQKIQEMRTAQELLCKVVIIMTSLYNALKSSYGKQKAIRQLEKDGYIKDNQLSNHNQSIFYNKKKSKLLTSVAGTHNLKDAVTDVWLAVGGLKSTNRYKEAKSTLEKARTKYKPKDTSIVGHSLGGSIAQAIASNTDRVTTFNGASLPFQNSQTNQTNYRTRGDVVSGFAIGKQHTKTLNSSTPIIGKVNNFLKNHEVRKIKNEPIYV